MKNCIGAACALWVLFFVVLPVRAEVDRVRAFGPGEKLSYVLKWAGVPAGDSVMEVVEGEYSGGANLYRVISTAKSRSLVDVIYKVRNRYETHIHPFDGLTRKYVFDMREGGKREDRLLIFDQNKLSVTRILKKKGDVQIKDYEIPLYTQDNLSALYALRNEPLRVGDSLTYRVFESRKNWELVIDVLATEEVEVRAGRFRTVVVHPKLKFEGIFRRKGELLVYMSDDEWHIPVLMKSKVSIGSINAELESFRLANGFRVVPSMVLSEKSD